jgi:signal recognition particle subunit SRP19
LKLQGKIIVWPANLDSSKSRKEGRKLTKAAALQAPRLEEINEAANRLSLEAEIEPGKSRPGAWWEKDGYLILPMKGERPHLLHSLSSEIRKMRAAKASQEKERKS